MALEIVGHAIVSADGMIADRNHRMPAVLRSDADWQRFQAALERSSLVVLGRLGHEAHANPGRRRLVATGRVAGFAADPGDARASLWNPATLPFADVLERLGLADGTIAVTGGTRVFELFLPLYTQFDLVTAEAATLPDGVPCFSGGPPGDVLAAAGLAISETSMLQPGVRLAVWRP